MSAKLLCATAIMAMGSFMFIDTADAQRRGGGAERGGNNTADAGGGRHGGARQGRGNRTAGQGRGNRTAGQPRGQRRNAQNNQAAPTRAAPRQATPRRAAQRPDVRPGRRFDRPRGWANGYRFSRGWRQARRWAARRWAARPYFNDRGCTAVARRANGYGRRIRGISGEGFGRRACRKALNRCENRLAYRQAQGRNPYAACVVASRY